MFACVHVGLSRINICNLCVCIQYDKVFIILLKMCASRCYGRRDKTKKGNGGNWKQPHLVDRIEHLKPAGSLVKEITVTGCSV